MLSKISSAVAAVTLFGIALSVASLHAGSQTAAPPPPPRPASFVPGQVRPAEDPAVVAHGKALYGINCQGCHGPDLRGGDMGGPNLLRSQVAMSDLHGELIVPIIGGARQAQGMPNIGLNPEDANAAAAYVRSMISGIGSQGVPPGKLKPLNIVVGDASHGKAYFAAHCQSCHSETGDLKGIATKFPDPKQLQGMWILGGRAIDHEKAGYKPTVTVTTAPGHTVNGELLHIDEFLVTLKPNDGVSQSFRRSGNTPEVTVHDATQAHRDLLPVYTDDDVHDVTAYLVTLK